MSDDLVVLVFQFTSWREEEEEALGLLLKHALKEEVALFVKQ